MKENLKNEINNAVTSPIFILSILLMLINDHFLKWNNIVPGILTGKISDFAGLFFFPILVCFLFRIKKTDNVIIIYVLSALAFTLINISKNISDFLVHSLYYVNLNWKLWPDFSDLFALLIMPISFLFVVKSEKKFSFTNQSIYLKNIIIIIAMLSCIYTSYDEPITNPVPGGDGVITVENISSNSIEISWVLASDHEAKQEDLTYEVFVSLTPDIDTKDNLGVDPCAIRPNEEKNIDRKIITDLDPNTSYYLNIGVNDSECGYSLYNMISVTTLAE